MLVTHSSAYEPRLEKVGRFLREHGHEVCWIESDFDHRTKTSGRSALEHHIYLSTVPYKRNLSARRLHSHYCFSKKVLKLLRQESFDLLYVMLPVNSLAPVAAQLKKENPKLRIVFDIIDLWPESLPFHGVEGFWPIQYWRRLRDEHLEAAELVLTECSLFQEKLGLDPGRSAVMYWPKEIDAPKMEWMSDPDILTAVYLGSMNHIIDIDGIVDVLKQVQKKKKVKLHIIGDGESRDRFLSALDTAQIGYEFHGFVYEEAEKMKIFAQCDFGINMMKSAVCVGLTMKSVDYFCYGLPIINNIPGDTWALVEQHDAGVNVGVSLSHTAEDAADELLAVKAGSEEERLARHLQIQQMYQKLFTESAMEAVLREYLLPLTVVRNW
jgi:glycosyltransferase involved in cell wall biosynthesis